MIKNQTTCKRCNAQFTSMRSTAVYCSDACRKITWQKDRRRKDKINRLRTEQRNEARRLERKRQAKEQRDWENYQRLSWLEEGG